MHVPVELSNRRNVKANQTGLNGAKQFACIIHLLQSFQFRLCENAFAFLFQSAKFGNSKNTSTSACSTRINDDLGLTNLDFNTLVTTTVEASEQ